MGDHGEVGEGSLDAWVQDRLGAGVAQGRPVLVQQVHQLLADKPTKEKVRKLDKELEEAQETIDEGNGVIPPRKQQEAKLTS